MSDGAEVDLRRQPAQRRGEERVDQLLDACGELLDAGGYDAVTTRAVAGRAGASIGSFYQFFANKGSLIRAFGQRNLDRYVARVGSSLGQNPPAGWREMFDVLFDEYVAMRRSVPGFAVVDFELVGSGDASQHLADFVAGYLADEFDVSVTPERLRALRISVEVADSLVRLAFRDDSTGDDTVLVEAKRMITGYLALNLPPDSQRASSSSL
jgi:AcrR family transcriptional regulator